MHRSSWIAFVLIAMCLGATAIKLHAATLNTDTVLGPDHPYPNETITVVDGIDPPTVVQVIEGATIGYDVEEFPPPVGLDVFGRSIVEVTGGYIRGREQSILLHDRSQLKMSGGEIDLSAIELRDSSQAFFHGGRYAYNAYGNSRVELYGSDGDSSNEGRAYENARLVQYSGYIDGGELYGNSSLIIHGGGMSFLSMFGESRMLFNGGQFIFGDVWLFDETIATIRGGTQVGGEYHVKDDARLHIYGYGLEFRPDNDGLAHFVRGTLADGSVAYIQYYLDDQDKIILHEVPEPGTWGMLMVGVFGIVAERLRKSRITRFPR
jgi:hypothetical protein